MSQVATGLGLIDIHARTHGLDSEVATYARGTKRLDYILMNEQLASHSTNCGADPFNHRFYSDHRGIWVDLELLGLFDRNLPPLARPQFRDILPSRPKLIRKYITELGHLLSTSDIPTRVDSLHDRNDIHLAETLDDKITAGMKSAGKKCKTTKRLPRSGKLHEAQTHLRIYQKLLTQIRTQRDMSAQILKCQEQLPQSIPLPSSLAETNAKLRASQREVRKLSRKAFDLRNQQKEELANAIATVEGTSKEKALQRVQRAQHTKEMFAQLPSIKPKTSSGISMIKVPVDKPDKPKEALVWKTITNATNVETAILNQQKLHISDKPKTPPSPKNL
jgi:hypothetical protein